MGKKLADESPLSAQKFLRSHGSSPLKLHLAQPEDAAPCCHAKYSPLLRQQGYHSPRLETLATRERDGV